MSSPRRWTGGVAPLWSVTPPPPRVKKYERLPILPGPGVSVVIVSSRIEETRTHYVDSRTVPCTGDDDQCWLDHRQVGNPRYCGWLAVALPKFTKVWLLSLTKVTVAVESRLRNEALDLRGLTIKVWRTGNHERSELHAALQLDTPRAEKVPECPDVRFCVERMLAGADRAKTPEGKGLGVFGRAFSAGKAVKP
jgi:hypothetical protein